MAKWTAHFKDSEAAEVLKRLMKKDPRLAKEAEKQARQAVKSVSAEKTAAGVERALRSIDDIDNLNARAGSTRHGYIEPTQAACDMCEEQIRPFQEDMEKRLKLGDVSGAAAVCAGIISGCYRVRNLASGVIEWGGEDTLCEIAGYAVDTFFKRAKKTKYPSSFLADEFLKKNAAEWALWLREKYR